MKMVKTTVSKEKKAMKDKIQTGKIIKNKPKNTKNLKDAVSKTVVPKIKTSIATAEQSPKSKTAVPKVKPSIAASGVKPKSKTAIPKIKTSITAATGQKPKSQTTLSKIKNNIAATGQNLKSKTAVPKIKTSIAASGQIPKSKTAVPKIKTSIAATEQNPKSENNKINITKSEKKVQNVNKKQQKVVTKVKQDQKKSLNTKVQQLKLVTTVPVETKADNELTEADLKKIEKKKVKKLAQKLKKQQKKKEPMPWVTTAVNGGLKENKLKNKQTSIDTANNDIESTNSKVLAKKDKKNKMRQRIKDQKLEERQTRDPAVEAATIFVGNLPTNTKRVQLIRLFKNYGPINSIRLRSAGGKVLHKHKQRREAGSLNAYLVLKDKATADKSLSLNGVEFKGNHLRVTPSLKTPQSHEKEEAKRTVFVGNLKYTATEETLREIFTSCGEIDYVRCIRDGDKGCKGVAYVCFKTADAVGLALELNETILDERPIHVERFTVKKLGAKGARDAQAEKQVKSKKGAKQRTNDKRPNLNKPGNKKASINNVNTDKKPKKNEFKGVKVDALKKKLILKKKKSNNQMLQLAKKIAPKPKTK